MASTIPIIPPHMWKVYRTLTGGGVRTQAGCRFRIVYGLGRPKWAICS